MPSAALPGAAAGRSRPAQSRGRTWTEAEKEQARQLIQGYQAQGLTLAETFRRTAQALPGRTSAAVAMLYYNVLRGHPTAAPKPAAGSTATPGPAARQAEARPAPPQTPPPPTPPAFSRELVEAFEGLPEYIARLHHRLDRVESRLTALPAPDVDSLAVWLAQLTRNLEHHLQQQQQASLQAHQAELEALKRQAAEFNRRLGQAHEGYRQARELYERFCTMASLSQIVGLAEFKEQMRAALDRWGSAFSPPA